MECIQTGWDLNGVADDLAMSMSLSNYSRLPGHVAGCIPFPQFSS